MLEAILCLNNIFVHVLFMCCSSWDKSYTSALKISCSGALQNISLKIQENFWVPVTQAASKKSKNHYHEKSVMFNNSGPIYNSVKRVCFTYLDLSNSRKSPSVSFCSFMFLYIPLYFFLFLSVPFYSFMFLYIPFYSFLFLYIPLYSFLFLSVPFCSFPFLYIPFYSFLFLSSPFCSFLFLSVQ